MLGTSYFMSSEQVNGKATLDHRSGVWAFGIIAYECLAGFRPFEKSNLGAHLISICTEPMPAPSSRAAVPPASTLGSKRRRRIARSISNLC
jgi:serine/threonine-protein kinase